MFFLKSWMKAYHEMDLSECEILKNGSHFEEHEHMSVYVYTYIIIIMIIIYY